MRCFIVRQTVQPQHGRGNHKHQSPDGMPILHDLSRFDTRSVEVQTEGTYGEVYMDINGRG